METDETILLTVKDKQTGEFKHLTIPLPKRIVLMFNFKLNSGQITLYNDEEVNELDNIEIDYFLANVTNDPYANYAGSVINLGYYAIRLLLTDGFISNKKPLIYATNLIDFALFKQTIPLRIPNKLTGHDITKDFIEYEKCGEESVHIIDLKFKKKHSENMQVWYSWFDYSKNKGYSVVREQNLQSAYNKVELANEKYTTSFDEVLVYHGFKEKVVSNKKRLN